MTFIDPAQLDLEDRVVAINRITKVVKGGRRLRFAALVFCFSVGWSRWVIQIC